MERLSDAENEARMLKGEMYHAFTPSLSAKRDKCRVATWNFNQAGDASRRKLVELWKDVVGDESPMPPVGANEDEEAILLQNEPYVDGPVKADYGYNIKLGKGCFINVNATFIDTCPITIGARTLVGPSCSFYSGGHPVDPFLRNGINGPEFGADIVIGEDCWLGGNVIVLPGVTIGRGCTVGAGSVVTKDIPAFHVVVGNPARILRKFEPQEPDPKLAEESSENPAIAAAAKVAGPS